MNMDEIRGTIMGLEEELEEFSRKYDMDEMRKKRGVYRRELRKAKDGNTPSPEYMKILRAANSVCDRYNRTKKRLSNLRKELEDATHQIECGCQNCKRREPSGEYSGLTPYVLSYRRHQANLLIKRRAFVFLEIDRASEEMVLLCLECSEYFTNPEKVGRSFMNTWPSFVWSILMDRDILEVYGSYVWRFVPEKWRYWWIDAVHGHEVFEAVRIDHPSSIFKDITDEISDMNRGLETNTLSEIMRCCNQHLIPTVLCPWGDSEYIHRCGKFPYDALVQRYLQKCYIKKISSDQICDSIYSCRDDYVRESSGDYDGLLLNPSWKVLPSIAFVEGQGPQVMTCREHDNGSKKAYIHAPRQPDHILPSQKGDQLCHAVIKPRLIKPMKASKYCNTYQMHEQRGSFQGIDTCDVSNFGDFSYCSVLLDQSESRSINNRPDINALLDNLKKDGYISEVTVQGLRRRALELCPSDDVVRKCLHGSTYVELEDAMQMQYEIGQDKSIKITLDMDCSNRHSEVHAKRNWIQSIVHCQKMDEGGYGSRFSVLPKFLSKSTDTRVMWTLSAMLVCVKELWKSTGKCPIFVSKWHGWLLSYLTRKCFPGVLVVCDKMNPIKGKHVSTIPKLMVKMGIDVGSRYEHEDLFTKFQDHENVRVLYNSVFSNTDDIEEYVCVNDDIIIVIFDEVDEDASIEDNVNAYGNVYELRFISSTVSLDGDFRWSGKIYCRHGGDHHKSWWVLNRNKRMFLQTKYGSYDDLECTNVDVCVYVMKRSKDMDMLKNEFMTYIGGQIKVQCYDHKLPLIVNRKTDQTCYQNRDVNDRFCDRKLYLKCPDLKCKCGLCRKCYEDAIRDDLEFISPPTIRDDGGNSDTDVFTSTCDDSDTFSRSTDDISENESLENSEDGQSNLLEKDGVCHGNDLLGPIENDDIDDFVVIGGNDEIPHENIEPEYFPTALAGDHGFLVEEDIPKGQYVSGHVVMNQCGSLLNRNDRDIIGYRSQKYFLQRIASVTDGKTLPLVYPEGMLFPSIFWSMVPKSGSIFGAIPSGLLVSSGCRGFASMKSHVRCRLGLPGSSTSTNPSYISFMYDILVNLTLNREDSRIILNRGLMESSSETGLQIRSRNDSLLSDCVDNKQTVRNLCASQKYHKMDFFLTFTCNQSEHFGMSNIKRWIDDSIWERYFPMFASYSLAEKSEIRKGLEQSASGLLLRNWMEVRKIFVKYLYTSSTSPYHPSEAIFSRDEYQSDVGNLPHMHMMISLNTLEMNGEQMEKVQDLIRASVVDIIRSDEVQNLIDEGILDDYNDVYTIQDLAKGILAHRCSPRCLRRVGCGEGPENFKCRKPNNLKISPDNTQHCFIPLSKNNSPDCVEKLVAIGLADPIVYNEFGVPSEFKSSCTIFHPTRHVPPTNPHEDLNISPVEGKTFAACRSMQNVQWLTASGGLNKYICKYIGKIDENNHVIIRAHPHDPGVLISQATFLHNTKISSSAINEARALEEKRGKKHPKGRAISLMEMWQVMLNYPQIHTDMVFENITTLPLEYRAGVECKVNRNFLDGICNDGDEIESLSYQIREEKHFPPWRQHREEELLVLQGLFTSSISVDKITKFSVRPPEVRQLFRNVGNYYRWFVIKNDRLGREMLENVLDVTMKSSMWIDGLQNQVCLRVKAIPEMCQYLESLDILDDIHSPTNIMKNFMMEIVHFNEMNSQNIEFECDDDHDTWDFMKSNLLYDDQYRHIPIPVFSYVKPTMGPRFILHIMLSLGEFDTELDLILHRTLRDSLRYAKLIGPMDDNESLKAYSNQLLRRYIEKQLVYFPNSLNVLDKWIVTAGDLFDSVILRNEMPITDMPPAHQTALNASKDSEVLETWVSMKEKFLGASFREMDSCLNLYCLPSIDDIKCCSRNHPLDWDAVSNFRKHPDQSEQSFDDQKLAIENNISAIDQYVNYTGQCLFVKCRVIAGSPGSGKSFLLNYIAIYAMSKGLKIAMTALMAQRAVHLGGIHLHKLFFLPVNKRLNLHRVAETALQSLFQHPVTLTVLKMVDVLFLDEVGQISAEMLSCLDIILRRIRNNNIFLGGLLFICTLDHKQLPPIDGKPFLVSPMVLSCFEFICLTESVRASGDMNLQRIQQIARMNPKRYDENPELICEFKNLLLDTCTFVDSWSDEIISPTTYRLYGKKYPARQASEQYIEQVRCQFNDDEFRERSAEDIQNPQQSHQEWQLANELTSNSLDHKCKEPRNLLFFIGATYQFTYNDDGNFTQSQIGLLLDLPSRNDIANFRKIPIMVAPPGIKVVEFDITLSRQDYIRDGWVMKYVGVAPERSHSAQMNMRGQRRQYGLKHHVTSTVHASMGDTLHKIVTEVASEGNDFRLWDKAQAIVLLSRTRLGSDIIFVGDKTDTVNALSSLIRTTNQWMNYMEKIIEMASVNGRSNYSQMSVFNHLECPFRLCDMSLPECNTGFVYMLVSIRAQTFSYIGETSNIITRLNQHNSGHGSKTTIPLSLRPYALFAYVCGFDGDRRLRLQFEYLWKRRRDDERMQGMNCVKQIARLASDIILQQNEDGYNVELRLVLNFQD